MKYIMHMSFINTYMLLYEWSVTVSVVRAQIPLDYYQYQLQE